MNSFANKMSLFKRLFLIFILFVIYFIFYSIYYTNTVCAGISQNVFRLHIVANSNSIEDQNLKYLVRDSVVNYINSIYNASSKTEVMNIAQNNIDEITLLAENTIKENGYDYPVKVSVGNFAFPTKQYGDITLPPGFYDALKIEIGDSDGQNWWCVMFPPLCFVDVTSGIVPDKSKEIMQENLSSEEFDLISKDTEDIKVKFKIVEVLQNFNISGIFM